MPKRHPQGVASATAADIERSIQALNIWPNAYGVTVEKPRGKALLYALDALNRALDRIRIGESRKTFH